MIGNNFLVREYENGKRTMYKQDYQPTLYVKSKRESKRKSKETNSIHRSTFKYKSKTSNEFALW